MRIKSNESEPGKKKSNIKLLDLLVLSIILIVSMLASAVVGVYYLDKYDVTYRVEAVKAFFSSLLYQEIKYETYLNADSQIDTLVLDIPFESMQAILDKRQEAVQIGILLTGDEDLVKAKATFDNQGPYNIELRLKGDWIEHIALDKWSYRINVKGDNTILGMKSFSIMDPSRRNYINEWAYHQNLFYEDILTTRYEFVNLIENGERKGIYALEENFRVELLESQEERQGVILCFNEDNLWINRANFMEESPQMLAEAEGQTHFMVTENNQAPIKVFQSNSVYENPVLRAEAETAIALLQSYFDGTSKATDVFDVDKFGTMLAITDLWGANHATYWHNLRYYYNPVTSLIEPIAYDGTPNIGTPTELASILSEQTFFDDPDLRTAYIAAVDRVSKPEYISQLKVEMQPSLDKYLPSLQTEFGADIAPSPWENLERRADLLRNQSNPPFPVLGGYAFDLNNPTELSFSVKNLMIVPVTIVSYEITTETTTYTIAANDLIHKGDLVADASAVRVLFIDEYNGVDTPETSAEYILSDEQMVALQNAETFSIFVNAKISGLDTTYHVELTPLDRIPDLTSRPVSLFEDAEQNLLSHPFISKLNDETVLIQSGEWIVEGDLIIPQQYEVVVSPGTTLHFDENAIFLLGNRIMSQGTESHPVRFTSKDSSWAGMVVLSAESKSSLEYTMFENTSGITREGWILTGGVTFYQSPVDLTFTTFSNHSGEDALNLIHSDYHMNYVSFQSAVADALDTDFSNGLIEYSNFTQIGGDAIDVSGSVTEVKNSQMSLITDKAVSAGESSVVSLTDVFIDTANIGVASKDLSSVVIDTITMNHISYAGFAAYEKKAAYGPAKITANAVQTTDVNNLALVQTGSEVIINGEIAEEQDLDVDTLYSLGILGN